MKKFLYITLLLGLFNTLSAKGSSGTYYISGKAYSSNKIMIKNAQLSVTIGNKTSIVTIDEKGRFEIAVDWVNTCPSMISKEKHEANNAKRNPKVIYVTYNTIQIEIDNNWQKYARVFPGSKKQVTKKHNLSFV